jgi:hypothetical protein
VKRYGPGSSAPPSAACYPHSISASGSPTSGSSPLQNYYLPGNLTTQTHTKLYADEDYTFSAALYSFGACYCVAPLLSSTCSQLLALSMRNHRDPINSFTIYTVNGCRANVS